MSTVIRVGTEPAAFVGEAAFFDGDKAVPQNATLTLDEGARELVIALAQSEHRWPLDKIREVPDQAGRDVLMLRLDGDPVQRLFLPNRTLAPRLPDRTRRAPVSRPGRIAAWAVAAVGAVAVIVLLLVPRLANQLADHIPPGGEHALGEVTLTQIRSALDQTGLQPVPFCTAPEGMAALDQLETRLTAGLDLPGPLSVHVLDHDMVNAFALPGGYIVLFRGLIDAAETPEEVAAVFAHEIGHVVSRDPTRHALRSAGSIGVLGLIFGDFAGGALVLFLAERLIDATYARDAEEAADRFAHETLLAAALPPSAIGSFFERLLKENGEPEGIVAHFLSHPQMGDRIAAARDATPDNAVFRPALTDPEWSALRKICRQ